MNNPLIEQLAAGLKHESLHADRAVVLGIDGARRSLLIKLISSGVMPRIAKLVEAGALGILSKSDNLVERSSGAEKKIGALGYV
ncbi:MAG: hypothetical protein AABN34_15265 [Acidobacteriota bacterium]